MVLAVSASPPTEAAVLVPVLLRPAGPRVLMIRRSLHGPFGGQLAFPGGNRTPRDASLLHTALREASEEVGLFADELTLVVQGPAVDTLTTNIRITPFLVTVEDPPDDLEPDDLEVDELVEIDLAALCDAHSLVEEVVQFPTWPEPRSMPARRVGDTLVWGVSYRILEALGPHLRPLLG